MNQYFWDAKAGMFFDYNIQKKQRSDYQYITTFYPLWAGLATPEQAKALHANLHIFDEPGGLLMSPYYTGVQWDYPYGWAPNNLLAIEGLRRYKFDDDANRLSVAWLGTIVENFRRDGTIREKYNVVTRSSESKVRVGYQENMVGFGWTNGVFLELLQALPQSERTKIGAPQAKAVGTN
jgi:alpha,alpha-trehalase